MLHNAKIWLHLIFYNQSAEAMNCQGMSFYHFAVKTFKGTLTPIIKTKLSHIFPILKLILPLEVVTIKKSTTVVCFTKLKFDCLGGWG